MVESSWGHLLSVGGVHPDLVLLAVISWTMLRGAAEGWVWALVGGLCLDLLSSAPFGLSPIALLVVCGLTRLARSQVYGASLMLPLLLTFPLSIVYYLGSMLFLASAGFLLDWNVTLLRIVVPASLLNVAAILIIFPLLRSLHRRTMARAAIF